MHTYCCARIHTDNLSPPDLFQCLSATSTHIYCLKKKICTGPSFKEKQNATVVIVCFSHGWQFLGSVAFTPGYLLATFQGEIEFLKQFSLAEPAVFGTLPGGRQAELQ